jgi:hypothetical protein
VSTSLSKLPGTAELGQPFQATPLSYDRMFVLLGYLLHLSNSPQEQNSTYHLAQPVASHAEWPMLQMSSSEALLQPRRKLDSSNLNSIRKVENLYSI